MEYATGTSRTTADRMLLLEQFSERQERGGKRRHGLCSHSGLPWDPRSGVCFLTENHKENDNDLSERRVRLCVSASGGEREREHVYAGHTGRNRHISFLRPGVTAHLS